VIRDERGNLYGTTQNGGVYGQGVVFELDSAGNQLVLYSFQGAPDGSQPWAGVTRDRAGNLYGTTANGGAANAGIVFQLNPQGQETVLYSFTGQADGANPHAGVIRDPAGVVFGTTFLGGIFGDGVAYKLKPE
jgi:uncharacterized repeat protein (TIGR03803 family)